MDPGPFGLAVRLARGRLAADRTTTDADLLGRYVGTGDPDAFAALVHRHGPAVLAACRRATGNGADADDAFQAVFLLLARRAGAVRDRRAVGGWLHGAAVRVGRAAARRAARRRRRERAAAPPPAADPFAPADRRDERAVIDQELARLADKYREPIALCHLEGLSHEDAARRLGWPVGTVSGRIARGKALLRDRLLRRGVAPAAGLAALTADAGAVPPALADAAVGLAAGRPVPPEVAGLATTGWRPPVAAWAAAVTLAVAVGGAALVGGDTPPPAPAPPAVVRLDHGAAVLGVTAAGDRIATAWADADVRVWTADGTPVGRLAGHPGGVAAVAFSPDGTALAAAGYDGTVRVWDVAAGRLRHTLSGHGETAAAVAFSPDGATLAAGGDDGGVRVWDARTGGLRRDLDAHAGRVWAVAFAPDGRLASAGGDGTVRVWDAAAGREALRVGGLRGGVYAVGFRAGGAELLASAGNAVRRFDAATGRDLGPLGGPTASVAWFAASPDGRTVAHRLDGRVRLWEAASGDARLTLDAPADPVGLAYSPDGRVLVAAAGDGATVWHLDRLLRPARPADPRPLWDGLAGRDAARAYRCVAALAADPDRAVPFLRERLHAGPDFDAALARLAADLDAPSFAARERASRALLAIGPDAAPALRRVAATGSAEARARAERVLAAAPADGPTVAQVRAVEALELMRSPAAREVLAALAARPADGPLRREAAAALVRLK